MSKRRKSYAVSANSFPPELLAEAKATPGGWVYSIDTAYAPDGPYGSVPPEGTIGAWKIAEDGTPTDEYWANPDYGSRPSSALARPFRRAVQTGASETLVSKIASLDSAHRRRRISARPLRSAGRRYRPRMSWDLDAAEARELAEEYLASWVPPRDDVWVVTAVDERDWGWVISWANKRATQGSTAIEDLYAGAGPLLIDRKTGRVAMCGSAFSVEYYVDAWHRGELPDEPRPA